MRGRGNTGFDGATFETHRAHIMQKLGVKNAADLVRMALSEIR
jgi:DNA-binding CsgD family transcriptional regulator